MIRTSRRRNLISFLFMPLCIALLLLGMFSIVWLRSSVIKLEYKLGELEKKKEECLKVKRMLLAEKASLFSFERVESSMGKNNRFIFPDRVKVIHIEKQKEPLPYRASLQKKQVAQP